MKLLHFWHPAHISGSAGVTLLLIVALGSGACATRPRQVIPETHAKPAAENWRININTAAGEELEELPGVGEVIAERIVSHRKQHGPFRRVEHLMMVRGISEKRFLELQPLITVD